MKKTILVLIVIGSSIAAYSQCKSSKVSHEGFYLSMAAGPAFGTINRHDNSENQYQVKGDAFGLDLQIGGAIKPNLILHATLQNKTLAGPKVNGIRVNNQHSFEENFFGAGITKYTSENFFVTGNAGVGHFIQSESIGNSNNNSTTTDAGFAFNVKAGKEWMVSKKWGLGGALFYSRTSLNNSGTVNSEHWNSNRFGIYFQATLCKSK